MNNIATYENVNSSGLHVLSTEEIDLVSGGRIPMAVVAGFIAALVAAEALGEKIGKAIAFM